MSGPHWLADTFAALLLGTAAYCVGRLVMARMRPRAVEHDVDMVHVVMGIAMAGMLVPAVDPVGNRSWEVVFVAAMAWFAWRAFREVLVHRATRSAVGHHLVHAVTCGAMVYMLVVLAAVSSRRVGARPGPGRYGRRRRIRAPPGFTACGRGPGGVPPRVRRVVRRPLDARCRRWAARPCPACLGRGRNGLFWRLDSQSAARSSCASRWATCWSPRCSDGGAGQSSERWAPQRPRERFRCLFSSRNLPPRKIVTGRNLFRRQVFCFFNNRGSNGTRYGAPISVGETASSAHPAPLLWPREQPACTRWGGAQASCRPAHGADRQPDGSRCLEGHHASGP